MLAPSRPVTSSRVTALGLAAILLALAALVALPQPARAVSASDVERALTTLINRSREAAGLKGLRTDNDLAAIAGLRATRMRDANVLNHTIGGSISNQLSWYDVSWYRFGENVGYSTATWGDRAAEAIHKMWLASPSHRALIMSRDFNYLGLGAAFRSSNGRTYASVIFTESSDHTTARASITDAERSGDDVSWSWNGYDPILQKHTAGLRDFDVQVRTGSGSWWTARARTTNTSLTLADRGGGTSYGLRVRATDRRGNVGPWTAESRIWVP